MRKITDEKLLELYHQGLTNREIADQLKVTQAAVFYRVERLGLVNNCHGNVVVDPGKVRILHEMGVTSIGIAHVLKVNVQVVQKHLKEMGLEDNCVRLRDMLNQ